MDRLGARFADEFVEQPNVGERSTRHYGIITPPGSVRVELPGRQAVRVKVQCTMK